MAGESYRVAEADLREVVQQLNFHLRSVADRLDQLEGFRGEPTMRSNQDDADPSPILTLDRSRTAPGNLNKLGRMVFRGRNAALGETDYADMFGQILDKATSFEDGRLVLRSRVAGALVEQMRIGGSAGGGGTDTGEGGVVVGEATGGGQGTGSLNAESLWVNGVAVQSGLTLTEASGNVTLTCGATAATLSQSAILYRNLNDQILFYQVQITVSSLNSGTGDVTITFPGAIPTQTPNNGSHTAPVYYENLSGLAGEVVFQLRTGSSAHRLYQGNAATMVRLTNAELTAGSYLAFSGFYFI